MKPPEDARRIGLVADTHSLNGSDLPDSVLRAFEGLDLILHLGDAGDWRVLDRLQGVAPVIGVLGGHNGEGEDARISGKTRTLQLGPKRLGLVHDLTMLPDSVAIDAPEFGALLSRTFAGPIDILAYAGTHTPRIVFSGATLMVNPGSPTLPVARPKGQGTLAIIELGERTVDARIIELTA